MLVRLWNGKLEKWDTEEVTVPGKPGIGPSDKYLKVRDSFIEPDENGNFVSSTYTDEELDAVHTFATARLTIDLWEKALGKKIQWPWRKSSDNRLKIHLYYELVDAVFRNDEQAIIFGTTGNPLKYTCKSFDIVSHETTHAIIESLFPSIHDEFGKLRFTLIESVADLSPIMLLTSIPKFLNKAMDDTQNDLLQTNFISEFGEGYSFKGNEIRNALFPDSKPEGHHQKSSIITNFIYLWLVASINSTNNYNTSAALKHNSYVIRNFLDAIKNNTKDKILQLFI